VRNEDELLQRLLSDRRLHSYPLDPEEHDADQGPPPRHTFLVLDRQAPQSAADLLHDQVPRIVGFLSYYGRETDKPERVVLVADRDENFDRVVASVVEIGGDALSEKSAEEVVGKQTSVDRALNWRWFLPVDTPQVKRREFLNQEHRAAILDRWPEASRKILNDKSPREAAADSKLRIPVLASVLVLEQGSNNQLHRPLLLELREKLGLPIPEPIDPATVHVVRLPLVRIPRVPLESVDDETLTQLFRRSVLNNATAAIVHVSREILRRPTMRENQIEEAYERLLTIVEDSVESLELIEQARAWCDSRNESNVRWDFLELGVRVTNGQPDEATRILQHIQQSHIHENGVAQQLYQILYSLGAIPDDPRAMRRVPKNAPHISANQVAAAERAPSGIWTPDADTPRERPAIWTPS
jgi:hypothetical protein